MSQPNPRTFVLSTGSLVLLLLATLFVGLIGGAVIGGLAVTFIGQRATQAGPAPARAWVGITYIPISEAVADARDLPVTHGALIISVMPSSPARSAGLREGDIIVSIDQRTLDETTGVLDIIRDKRPGDRVPFTVLRDGATRTVMVTVGRSPLRPGGRLDALRRFIGDVLGR